MRKTFAALTLALLTVLALPLASPAQEQDDGFQSVFCHDDSHCSYCQGTCYQGAYCVC